jgi:CheY-like chemotaxis protein
VTCFDDPMAAAAAIGKAVVPDVLIVDYLMPGLDGIALLRRVRPRLPRGVRVILISGHADRLAPDQLATLGLGDLLSKPLDLDALCAHVGGVQGRR